MFNTFKTNTDTNVCIGNIKKYWIPTVEYRKLSEVVLVHPWTVIFILSVMRKWDTSGKRYSGTDYNQSIGQCSIIDEGTLIFDLLLILSFWQCKIDPKVGRSEISKKSYVAQSDKILQNLSRKITVQKSLESPGIPAGNLAMVSGLDGTHFRKFCWQKVTWCVMDNQWHFRCTCTTLLPQ